MRTLRSIIAALKLLCLLLETGQKLQNYLQSENHVKHVPQDNEQGFTTPIEGEHAEMFAYSFIRIRPPLPKPSNFSPRYPLPISGR